MADSIIKVKLDSLLWQIRELCRKYKLQVWGNQSLANQIYQDLLFIYHVPDLCASGKLELDIQYIGDGKLTEVSYRSLLSLKEPQHINTAFKRLWKQLQSCVLKPLFEGRDFVMFAIEKKDTKKYMTLLLELMKYLASIELEKYDSNAGYTYFKKDLNKAIAKTFGQFYTPSSVTASVVRQVDPKTGESVLDPSSGSCSFLAEAANHIAKSESVDMATAFKDLYGTEVEPNIYAEGVMNMFINFGILPDMNERIREVDALLDMATNTILFKKIVANPPFGADARSFLEFYYQTIIEPPTGKAKKGTKKVVLNPEVKCEIPFPKISESAILFFQYIVQKLAPGGKAGVVMSATIFNDGFKDMMKWFLECCSLDKIIINPAGTFKEQGTGIETFSFIFTKGTPTTKIDIAMLGAEDDVLRSITIDQVKEAGWKLQVKEEEKKVEYTGQYELKKLCEVCNFVGGKGNQDRSDEYNIPYYESNGIYGYVKDPLYTGEYIITARCMSIGSVHYVNGPFYPSDHTINMTSSDNTILDNRFFYNWLILTNKVLKDLSSGIKPGIRKSDVMEIEMPVPPLPIQQEIISNLDRIFADPQDMKDCLAFTDKAMDLMLKDPSGKALEDVMGGLRLKRSHQTAAASIKAQMAAVMRSVGARGYEKKKLDIICKVSFGERITKKDNTGSIYPVYGSGFDTFRTDKFNREGMTCKIGRFAISEVNMVILVNGPYWLMDSGFTVESKDESVMINEFLWHLLLTDKNRLSQCSTGSCQKNIEMDRFYMLEYSCPPLPIQQETLTILNEMDAEFKVMEQMAAKAEQRAKYILDGYLTSQPTAEPSEEVLEPVEPLEPVSAPENTLVASSVSEPTPITPPTTVKKIMKLKKRSVE